MEAIFVKNVLPNGLYKDDRMAKRPHCAVRIKELLTERTTIYDKT
jgi:hypothetical protein